MSRTLEVLRKVQQDHDVFGIPPAPFAATEKLRSPNGKASALDLDALAREEARGLVQRLFLAAGPKLRQVVFCGVDEGNRSSWMCANASRNLAAETTLPVCAVDANLSNPALHHFLREQESPSLVPGACKFARPVSENLWLCNGSLTNNNGVGRSLEQLRLRLGDLCSHFEHVLINAPPMGSSGDAAVIGQWVDGVVLVLEAHSTRRVAALKAKQQLDAAKVKLLGTVLYNRTFPIPPKIYGWR